MLNESQKEKSRRRAGGGNKIKITTTKTIEIKRKRGKRRIRKLYAVFQFLPSLLVELYLLYIRSFSFCIHLSLSFHKIDFK